ncbi:MULTISPECIES: MFS transporter [unclassified Duganella]|uniref:MFS transporter n=1 Tax=unclassified Duganella TaxID=2636909 RepID=UPI00088418F4|nr:MULTISPECIES: MFS transporter [unclassified Duganella]SDG17303.1 Fucose permease [Duganella sp. OV458]SDJ30623.1 Fucose permease [Duganella sp. OV510]
MNIVGPQQRLSTRLTFLASGLAMAAWAPLVPFAKARLGLSEAELGLLLLCLGGGSLVAMPFTGMLTARYGCRLVVLLSGALICLVLPGLAWAPTSLLLGATLLLVGAAMGTMDVAMNVQAVIVERDSGGALMSGFHGLFSLGGFIGAGLMALMLWLGTTPTASAAAISVLVALALLVASPYLLRHTDVADRDTPLFVVPHGAVIFIGVLCFLCFLAEGAILDWSAVLLTTDQGLDASRAGLGYAAFAIAMTLGRLTGDRVVGKLGGKRVLLLGGLCGAAGFFLSVLAPSVPLALLGFVLIGLGASNVVPILFTAAGNQRAMPASLAIAAVTTLGYTGILAGPAMIGFVAHASSLSLAFGGLGCFMLLIATSARLGAAKAG